MLAIATHVIICTLMAYGMIFSKTAVQSYIVLANLVVIFLGLRLFKGCMLTQHEDGTTTRLGVITMVENPEDISLHNFEEVAVGFSIVLQLAKTIALVLHLDQILF